MALVETVDNLIRTTLCSAVQAAEPAPAVREALLVAAAEENSLRSTVGPTVPPLVEGLQERNEPSDDWSTQIATALPLMRKQLWLLAGQWDAVVK